MALGAVSLLITGAGCEVTGDDTDGFSSEEWALVKQIQPLSTPMPRNPFNHLDQDDAVARLGQKLFYETEHAEAITVDAPAGVTPAGKKGETGKVGCITCHDPNRAYADGRPGPVSHARTTTRRNSPTMVNLGWFEWIGWTGRHDSMVMHGTGVMGTSATPLAIAHYLYKEYKDEYNNAFPNTPLDPALAADAMDAARFPATGGPKAAGAADGPWEKMAPSDQRAIQQIQYNMGRVWDTYPRKLTTPNSPFERYVKGDYAALSPTQKNGLRLFVGKAACNDCHNGPLLSDNRFHNIGVSDPPGTATMSMDQGRLPDMAITLANVFNGAGEFSDDPAAGREKHKFITNTMDPAMKGAFRTPTLLNIDITGPYFHTGLVTTLEEVVRHYNDGGGQPGTFAGDKDPRLKPLGLSESEISDIVAFLKSLTGDPPDQDWVRDIRPPATP